jgi:radical SAM superfamily enzyme YgiQ (UPF0313 family)
VQPPIGGGREDVTPPLSALCLASVLEAEGYRPQVVDLNLLAKQGGFDTTKPLRTQFVKTLPKRASRVDVIGVTTWSYNFDVTMEFVEAVRKKHPQAAIVLGGPHATFVDREILEAFASVDYVLRDEGDYTLPRLLDTLRAGAAADALAEIPGLTWRREGAVVRNASGATVEDLDALPYPAYHLIDVRDYLACQPTLVIEAGRGCPYDCNFCSTSNMFQRKYRVKSAPRLVDEIEWAMKATGSNRFELLHDNLVANKKYVSALCQEIRRRNIDVDWSCTSRTDNLQEDVAEEMFLAGCNSIFFGVESLSLDRQRWTGKKLQPPKVHAAVEMTRRQHITPAVGIILGFPEESAEELDATLGAAVRWTTEPGIRAEVSTAMLRYYPGARLFEHASELRYDPLVATDACALPGYTLRDEWRGMTHLFPVQAIHTSAEETRRNLVRRNLVRAMLKVCPQTFRACLDALGLSAHALLEQMTAAREFTFLEAPGTHVIWNETVRALGAVVEASGSAPARELLTCEVPFWETLPVAESMQTLEHVIHPKGFAQDDLLAWARGEQPGTPLPLEGTSILAIRAGPEAVVWFTEKPQEVLATFEQSYAEDRRGTLEFVRGLTRGL